MTIFDFESMWVESFIVKDTETTANQQHGLGSTSHFVKDIVQLDARTLFTLHSYSSWLGIGFNEAAENFHEGHFCQFCHNLFNYIFSLFMISRKIFSFLVTENWFIFRRLTSWSFCSSLIQLFFSKKSPVVFFNFRAAADNAIFSTPSILLITFFSCLPCY